MPDPAPDPASSEFRRPICARCRYPLGGRPACPECGSTNEELSSDAITLLDDPNLLHTMLRQHRTMIVLRLWTWAPPLLWPLFFEKPWGRFYAVIAAVSVVAIARDMRFLITSTATLPPSFRNPRLLAGALFAPTTLIVLSVLLVVPLFAARLEGAAMVVVGILGILSHAAFFVSFFLNARWQHRRARGMSRPSLTESMRHLSWFPLASLAVVLLTTPIGFIGVVLAYPLALGSVLTLCAGDVLLRKELTMWLKAIPAAAR